MSDVLEVRWPERFGQRTVRINAEDFDPAKHQLASEPAVTAEPAKVEPQVSGRRRRTE